MMHVLFLTCVAIIIAVVTWFEWPSLNDTAIKSVYLTIVIAVFILTFVITIWPDTPGPLQGVRMLFKPLTLPWMRR
ncbi:hypothetical protein PCCS19_12590 [Paenibacillus sp. CCS19]|uniref:hypothetical protein n=1 Tax=Paenibacillus sp. CCS19 TaxID=3158387 RepID=UPI00256E3264|nr:hypothetical protein [Paenibacillus cellulosilyticus]GMK38205.1 hypothetical protein PCCS19_12590 [Paenibacillus cellulosilyticus]